MAILFMIKYKSWNSQFKSWDMRVVSISIWISWRKSERDACLLNKTVHLTMSTGILKLSLLTLNCLLLIVTDCYHWLLIILFCVFVFLSDSKLPIQIALLMHLTIQCTSHPTVQQRYPDSGTHCIKEVKIRCERNKNEITLRVL